MKHYNALVDRHEVNVPTVCAWCGVRPGADWREARLINQQLWLQLHHTLLLPICPVCEGYLTALHRVERQLNRALLLIAAPLAAAVVAGLERLTGAERDWLIFVIGVGFVTVALRWIAQLLLAATGLEQAWIRRRVSEPPAGYAGDWDLPGEVVGERRLHFYSPTFHRTFAALNPDLAEQSRHERT